MVKSRPMLFSAPMVRAIVDGRKTQTRRAIPWRTLEKLTMRPEHLIDAVHACKYGQDGDRVWIKETWRRHEEQVHYRADDLLLPIHVDRDDRALFAQRWKLNHFGLKWKPAIHMRREYSRGELELVSVWVEKLLDITEDDARAEGIYELWPGAWGWQPSAVAPGKSARFAYLALWDTINGAGSALSNPWLWAMKFKRVHA